MATCQTSQWVSTAPYVRLTVTESSNTGTTSTLSWTLQYIASSAASTSSARDYSIRIGGETVRSGTFSINGKTGTQTIATGSKTINKTTSSQSISFSCSFEFNLTWSGSYSGTRTASGSITVAAKTSYTYTYNANGGSGAPGKQTKWAGTALKLSSTKPTRTGYTFQGWAITSGGSVSYQPGDSCTRDTNTTFYAVWKANTYTVSYNANGGSGAPSNQTKTHGVSLTLSSTKPTRTNYTFKGWGTSASSTTVAYSPGGTYSANAAITLYAIWELASSAPVISNLSVDRCNSSGEVSDDGSYFIVKFDWSCETTVKTISIQRKVSTASTWTTTNLTVSGTSGNVNRYYSLPVSIFDRSETAYDVRITVTDQNRSTVIDEKLPAMHFELDFLAGGHGVAVGTPATLKDVFDVNYVSRLRNGTYVHNASEDAGAIGYMKFARITVTEAYIDNPIKITLCKRAMERTCTLHILFFNNSGTDPNVSSFLREGDSNYKVYIVKADTSTWDLYIKTTETYDFVGVLECTTNFDYMSDKVQIEWMNEFESSLPSGYIEAEDLDSRLLWSGAHFMNATQTINLSSSVLDQKHGIVLVFSAYSSGATYTHFHTAYIPKELVSKHPGAMHIFTMNQNSSIYRKVLYINTTSITGHSSNSTNFTMCGETVNNQLFCLCYVIGV